MELNQPVYKEGFIKFKQGLRSNWEKRYASIYNLILCIYTDGTKQSEVQRFYSHNSWLSTSSKSLKGLLIVNDETENRLYLLETGSKDSLKNWLHAFMSAGWKTPIKHKDSKREIPTMLSGKNGSPTMLSYRKNSTTVLSNSLPHNKDVQNFANLNMERSVSMPSLNYIDPKELQQTLVDSFENTNQKSQLNRQMAEVKRRMKSSISESGYCSKESLLMENEKQAQKTRFQRDMTVPDNNDSVGELRKTSSLGRNTATNEMGRYRVDYDNNIEEVFKDTIRSDIVLPEIEDPDATPKLEKKPSMSQIILNLKSKFGSTSSKKKVKKGLKRIGNNERYSGRLLWNYNGIWRDKWFFYQNGILQGFKEVGYKPVDLTIDVKICTLTSFTGDDLMKRLNLFKLTTNDNIVHMFAAWNEEEYEAWVEYLSCSAQHKEEIQGVTMEVTAKSPDCEENFIIPYERALSNQESQKSSTSSSNSNTRVDSVDSGNDGDESGLESSLTAMQIRAKKLNSPKLESNSLLQNLMNSKKESAAQNITSKRSPPISLDLDTTDSAMNFVRQQNYTSQTSPTLQITPTLDDMRISQDLKRQKRPFSLGSKQRWSYYGNSKDLKKVFPESEFLQIPNKSQNLIPLKTQSEEILTRDIDLDSASQAGSLESPTSLRPSSADSILAHTPSSNEGATFANSWDMYRYRKNFSEDEISDSCSTNSANISTDTKRDDLEDSLREETFLRKRRNSLKLERGEVISQLAVLQERPKKPNKNAVEIPNPAENKSEKISKLQQRIEQIDSQINIIDRKMNHRVTPINIPNKNGKRGNNMFKNKIRGSSKPKLNVNGLNSAVSVESLTSSGSRDSRDGQDLELHQHQYSIPENFVPAPRSKAFSDSSKENPMHSKQLSGLEELLLTTEKLEQSGKLSRTLPNKPLSMSDKWRSKSLGSMDINLDNNPAVSGNNNIEAGNKAKYEHSLSSDNNIKSESEMIIEDFERFSAILSNQWKQQEKERVFQV